MFQPLKAPSSRDLLKWCAYAALLLAPGSSVVIVALWLIRQWPLRLRAEQGDFRTSHE